MLGRTEFALRVIWYRGRGKENSREGVGLAGRRETEERRVKWLKEKSEVFKENNWKVRKFFPSPVGNSWTNLPQRYTTHLICQSHLYRYHHQTWGNHVRGEPVFGAFKLATASFYTPLFQSDRNCFDCVLDTWFPLGTEWNNVVYYTDVFFIWITLRPKNWLLWWMQGEWNW